MNNENRDPNKFYCAELIMCAYLQAKGHKYEMELTDTGKVTFIFDKTSEFMKDFAEFKHDDVLRNTVTNFYATRKAMFKFKETNANEQ
ncbi:MAG: hypothetical protein GX947_07635 [Tissierellia bacterium]|nr:hypothetical protein [Tissierellia bacterium]